MYLYQTFCRGRKFEFGIMLEIKNYLASVSMLNHFHSQYDIVMKSICGKASNVPITTVNERWTGEVSSLIKTCSSDGVTNANDTGIFKQLELKKTFNGDKCIGGKTLKQWITFLFCCNKF